MLCCSSYEQFRTVKRFSGGVQSMGPMSNDCATMFNEPYAGCKCGGDMVPITEVNRLLIDCC